ncbi:MAG: dehydratase [SAR86 cluster bacterium]|jgi:acyl dehydratase|nr:dehydratase [SAR86 cluster bacterium]MBL6810711.1 dehydratase [SAR86 cluster bacterium]|tara:strand:- start:882 stop:1277 length:396 start_codon:yes stop_codon:yes gene_type:complete
MSLGIGDSFKLTKNPISRTTLALFAGASGDHNPIHIDLDFVKKAGLDDVFAHGMLGMAYLGQLLTNNFSQEKIKKYSAKFVSITQIGAEFSLSGHIIDEIVLDGDKCLKIEIKAEDQHQDIKIVGEAIIAS